MVMGMPLTGFVLLGMFWILTTMYCITYANPVWALVDAVLFVGACVWLRSISKNDGYAFSQKLLRLRLRHRNVNKDKWGAVSYSPFKRLNNDK